jgi:ATP/maltotriose-dependent transcriptional regulator MalT
VPLDDQREWFRYHQLFRQLLQHQLERRYQRDEIAGLHRQASQWFAAHDQLEEAVQHALLAGDTAGAAQIVAQHRHALINQDEWRRLEILLQVLPRTIVETQPELLLAKAWGAHNRYNLLQMPDLINQAEILIAQLGLEPAVARSLRGEVALFRSYLAYWANDMPDVVSQAQQALADLPLDWWHARLVTRLFLASAITRWAIPRVRPRPCQPASLSSGQRSLSDALAHDHLFCLLARRRFAGCSGCRQPGADSKRAASLSPNRQLGALLQRNRPLPSE